jgi:UPF0755 protein
MSIRPLIISTGLIAASAGLASAQPYPTNPKAFGGLAPFAATTPTGAGAVLASKLAKIGTPLGDLRVADPSPPPPTRARAFDASEGTRLDPLLNKTYDLHYAKVIPSDLK